MAKPKPAKVLLATFTFVLGLVLGIILFVVAILGTIIGVGTAVPVGDVMGAITTAPVIDENSTLYKSTVLEALQQVLEDVRNFDQISLKSLYDTYGINVFKGISGLDFTDRSFYDAPLTSIVGDLSILLNGIYLADIGKIANVDFSSYNLPILDDNMNVGLNVAIDNIMSSLNSDLSIRKIKDSFGIDIGVDDNDMLAALQDIRLADFGGAIDALTINTLLNADTDMFLPYGANDVYVAVPEEEQYELVDDSELVAPLLTAVNDGVETYIAGGDENGNLIVRETRYYKDANGKLTVNNSCYNEGFQKPEGVQIMRRRLYKRYEGNSAANGEYFVKAFANRIATFNADTGAYTLKNDDFISLKEVFKSDGAGGKTSYNGDVQNGKVTVSSLAYDVAEGETTLVEVSPFFAMTDETLTKDSSLCEVEDAATVTYLRLHKGTSTPVLQKIAWLSIGELRNADDFLNTLRIGDIIEYNDDTAHILVALKNSTLKSLGEDVNHLEIGDVLDITDESALIMRSLAARHCTLDDLDKIADELTIGELIEVDFDSYQEAPGTGDFVRVPIYVEYNSFAEEMYGDFVRGDYTPDDGTFVPNPAGEWVQTYYYTLYDQPTHGDAMRYDRTSEGSTALAIQSIARRGCKMGDMGSQMDELTIAELVRMDKDSAHLFKSLAKKGKKLSTIAEDANTLEIGEIILIDENSSWLMQSLDRRHCTLDDMSTITDKLTLEEMLEIIPDSYTKDASGIYVQVEDPESYIPYTQGRDQEWRHAFIENEEGGYDPYLGELPPADGAEVFVHGAYYTLYNPSVHTPSNESVRQEGGVVTRFSKVEVEGASSPLLQRFSNASLSGFSDAFDNLMLSEVLDINGDMYDVIDPAKLQLDEESNRYYYGDDIASQDTVYYYDDANSVYRIASQKEMKAYKDSGSPALFYITQHGDAASIIKKLAYAKVNGLEGAMDAVMADLMLSEIIDINTYDAVTLVGEVDNKSDYHPAQEEEYFFIEWDGETTINNKPVVFTYDAQMSGKYFAQEYRYVLLGEDDPRLGSTTTKYVQYKPITDDLSHAAQHVQEGNVYVKNGEEYVHNVPLATYCVAKTKYDKLYYRTIVESELKGAVALQSYDGSGLYVDVLGTKTAYDNTNPAHLGLNVYFKEEGGTFYVPIGDKNYGFHDGEDLRLGAQYCNDVYFSIDRADIGGKYQKEDVYVFVNGNYESYDESKLDHTSETAAYYIKKVGYIATIEETFYIYDGSKYATDLDPVKVDPQRLRSSRVLVTLAHETVNDMDSVIKTAKIGDFMEMTPGTIFDNEEIANSTIDSLGLTLQTVLSDMTIGDLLEWGNVTSASAEIRDALKDITIQQFFAALVFDKDTGDIKINMESLYNLE